MRKGVKKLLSVSLFIGMAGCFISSTRSNQTDKNSFIHVMSVVPEVPLQVEFAGENISLDRIDMYERYDRELTGFCYNHSTTLLVLKRANRYFPMIVPVLEKNGIPADFVYLAAIESSFNPKALSPVKAAGLWQLMPTTAQQLGLEVNEYVDERYHVEKSTEVACRYLKSAYAEYGDWMAAAASYNAGRGRISTELKKQQAQNVFDLWLNEETSRYVFRLMAMKAVLSNPVGYGFAIKKKQLYQPVRTRLVTVTTPIDDLAQFAKDNGITYAQLKEYNLWLRDRSLPNKTGREYQIAIPERDDLYYTTRKIETYQKGWTVD